MIFLLSTYMLNWQNPSGRAMALGTTQPLTEMIKAKCTLVQALRLCTGRTAHRGSRGIALIFHDLGTIRGWGISFTPRSLFTSGKEPVPIVQEVGWAPGPVSASAENLAPTGIRSPDRPASSQSLYRLRYPTHDINEYQEYFLVSKRGGCVGLIILPHLCIDCLEIWDPQPPGTLWACPGL